MTRFFTSQHYGEHRVTASLSAGPGAANDRQLRTNPPRNSDECVTSAAARHSHQLNLQAMAILQSVDDPSLTAHFRRPRPTLSPDACQFALESDFSRQLRTLPAYGSAFFTIIVASLNMLAQCLQRSKRK
eukprot:TRINITY_DN2071_c0_g1_i1.p1 TRINITY_DN2071_c0_g1~~TRINITY_DN2071_c0_g1_i1.p1  ORF type:complete len:130 (+),score=5.93 TRINITY_DN2071_c0_g1_i1:309-698(+)